MGLIEINAKYLRRRTVKSFLEDLGSESGMERENIDSAIKHMYSPDLRSGWGIHVFQEIKLLTRKADRESLDSAIEELVNLGMQRYVISSVHLNAHSNLFSGPLPSTIEAFSNLKLLDLRNNSFSGALTVNFSKLTNLCTLDLASNRFKGQLPNSLSNCHELRILNLAKNQFYGEIPLTYTNLSNLSFLSFSNNGITNIPQALSVLQHLKNLMTLILTKNFRGEKLPVFVNEFERLLVLAIANCALDGQIPRWLLNCPKLEVLDLSWNHLTGVIPPWIGQMERLFYLDFSNNSLSGDLPESLTNLKSLISSNITSWILGSSTGIPLYVKKNQNQSGKGLQYNQVSSFPPSIYLSSNNITGPISPKLGRLIQLHVLDLSKNNITGTIPDTISEMKNLEVLDLSSNDLHGTIPSSLNKLTFISMFRVVDNHLHGPIPTGTQFSWFPNSLATAVKWTVNSIQKSKPYRVPNTRISFP